MADDALLGISARFLDGRELMAAVEAARRAGFKRLDAFTPYPVEGLGRLLMRPDAVIPWATFLGGLAGALLGLWLGWFINVVDYPLNIGGRPLAAWPAFILPAFELAALFGAIGAIGAMLIRNGLPRLHHPMFEAPAFERASDDAFFLLIEDGDGEAARRFMIERGGFDVGEVRQRWIG